MKLIKVLNNTLTYPYTVSDLKLDNPNTSFPENIENTDLSTFNVFEVLETPKPDDEYYTKKVYEGIPIFQNTNYYQNWIIEEANPEYTSIYIEKEWDKIRQRRNALLYESDWTQVLDAPLTDEKRQEWTVYRQLLRDVTTQPTPFEIIWPNKP
jgi:hypothetical protein